MVELPVAVSVCIANYNGLALIDACIDSVKSQDFDLPLEIIVHDDASTDGSADYINRKYPDVKLIRSTENVGFCVANNRMVAAARGRFVLLLNNDAMLFKDALATLAAAAGDSTSAVMSLSQYACSDGQLVDRGMLLDPFFNPVPNLDPARTEVAFAIGACLWIPRDVWGEIGGFPPWFDSIAEDMMLCCAARLKGYPVRVLPTSGYRHHGGNSFGGGNVKDGKLSSTYRRRALSERNKSFVMVMCSPAIWLACVLPIHLLLLILEGGILSLLKWDSRLWLQIYGPALHALWLQRAQLMQGRRQIQAGRNLSLPEWLRTVSWLPYKLRMLFCYGLPELK